MAKRIRVTEVIVPPEQSEQHVIKKACHIAGIRPEEVRRSEIVRQSLDARQKRDIKYVYTVDLITAGGVKYNKWDRRVQEADPVRYAPQATGTKRLSAPVAVIGTGPAGLFAALLLAENGYRPLVYERGKRVDERQRDVARFWEGGALDPESNVQFGEGGAGTFSDGKLNTTVNDRQGRNRFVLETFVRFGAPKDILYVSQPHIGTDLLRTVVVNMREEIIRLGGRFFFSTGIRGIETEDGKLKGLITDAGGTIEVSAAVFAIGHSARDTFAMLLDGGVSMEPKPFAVGMRIEHPQDMIDRNQYGEDADRSLFPPASYKLTHRAQNGRSVYSFCMCPGGYVINASSREGGTVVNGMSYRSRDAKNANSAVIVSVTPKDFPNPDEPLSGAAFQRELEERAFRAGGGKIPQQRFGEFASEAPAGGEEFFTCAKGARADADLRSVFPDAVREAFVEGVHAFAKKIPGFDREDAILSAVESRTSSPVRMIRNDLYESNIAGIYPCGEGAGYAGGITSSAMDGLKTAEAIMARFAPVCAKQSAKAYDREQGEMTF